MVVMKYYVYKDKQISDSNLTVSEGAPFSITCNSIPTGKPKPKLDWLKQLKEVFFFNLIFIKNRSTYYT